VASEEPEILEERQVDFYGDMIIAVLVRVAGTVQVVVPVRHICEVLGINWDSQRKRIVRDDVLESVAVKMTVTARDGKRYKSVCLPLEYLHGWLFGITPSQVKEEHRERIKLYRKDCFRVLSAAFQADLALPDSSAPKAETGMTLAQVRDLGLAISQMAEQQMALEGRVDHIDTRLDRAADVVGSLQRRMSTVEDKLNPGEMITEAQAAEISNQVKALAHLLSRKEKDKNHYQGVFGELYRQFGVTSYTRIPQAKYAEVLKFLDEWREAVAEGE
jgi:hypothetical protein